MVSAAVWASVEVGLTGTRASQNLLILTVGGMQNEKVPVNVAKNRYGPGDRTGGSAIWLPFNQKTFVFSG